MDSVAKLILQWHVSEQCNLRCAHCYQESWASGELDANLWPDVLRQFHELTRSLGAWGHVNLTGGEPLAHPRLFHLLEMMASRRHWMSFAILSNGTLIDSAAARQIASLRPGFVQVSIDGSQATHDRIRGEGSFAAATAGVRQLVKHGVKTMLAFTAHRQNYRDFPAVAQLGRRLGVWRVWADRMVPLGLACTAEALPPDETLEFMRILQLERTRRTWSNTEIAAHRALQFLLDGGEPYRCTAGAGLLTVLASGDVVPCRRMPLVMGNVRDNTLQQIYREHNLLQELRHERIAQGCERCFYARTCGGGLRCAAHAAYGTAFRADPGCWLAKPASVDPRDNVPMGRRLALPVVSAVAGGFGR